MIAGWTVVERGGGGSVESCCRLHRSCRLNCGLRRLPLWVRAVPQLCLDRKVRTTSSSSCAPPSASLRLSNVSASSQSSSYELSSAWES